LPLFADLFRHLGPSESHVGDDAVVDEPDSIGQPAWVIGTEHARRRAKRR